MAERIAFIAGESGPSGPLGRYLPAAPEGVAQAWLTQTLAPGAWLIDPFGAAPRLVVAAARAGYRIMTAVNNPIARLLLELAARPPLESELRQTLADLAVEKKGSERLEPHLRALYATECAACGASIEAQAFIWERGESTPSGRIYSCPHCKDSGTRPASPADRQRAARFSPGELHRARALERVTPLDDPDRGYVEEALAMYLPRALYALQTLVNRLEGQPLPRRRLLSALLLAVFDQANVLWPDPPARARPRQLSAPPRFVEKNIWLALEEAVAAWPRSLPAAGEAPLPLCVWPDLPPASGGICLFEGRLKDLAEQIAAPPAVVLAGSPSFAAMLTALPRPNQAYWTLSALWAGWLWGHEANASFKSVLRRRRYDWNWHAEALSAALQTLAGLLPPDAPALALLGEAEPGLLSAAMLAGHLAGFNLHGLALRLPEDQAQIHWRRRAPDAAALAAASAPASAAAAVTPAALASDATAPASGEQTDGTAQPAPSTAVEAAPAAAESVTAEQPEAAAQPKSDQMLIQALRDYLSQRGEPAAYLLLHAHGLQTLLEALPAGLPGGLPAEPIALLQHTDKLIQNAVTQSAAFVRLSSERGLENERVYEGSRPQESGLWWQSSAAAGKKRRKKAAPSKAASNKSAPAEAASGGAIPLQADTPSLADQVEMLLVRGLRKAPGIGLAELDRQVCHSLPGLLTPERELVAECLASYGEQDALQSWRLRPEDAPAARRDDLQRIQTLLEETGARLGFEVSRLPYGDPAQGHSLLAWHSRQQDYWFAIIASAWLSKVVFADLPRPRGKGLPQRIIVLPGGRARLVDYKLRRDPRLRAAVEEAWRLVKFRHLRRLADDPDLTVDAFVRLLTADPLGNETPQLSLF